MLVASELGAEIEAVAMAATLEMKTKDIASVLTGDAAWEEAQKLRFSSFAKLLD